MLLAQAGERGWGAFRLQACHKFSLIMKSVFLSGFLPVCRRSLNNYRPDTDYDSLLNVSEFHSSGSSLLESDAAAFFTPAGLKFNYLNFGPP